MWIVYQTTCLVNMRRYIGVHNGKKKDYLGSGKALKNAIKKYGEHNFIRETLYKFKTAEEAYAKEAELVDLMLIEDRNYYNLITGGKIGQINRKHSKYTTQKMSKILKGKTKPPFSTEHRAKISANMKGNQFWLGKKHTEESKQKVSEAKKGENHPMYGKQLTEEWKDNIRKANTGKKRSKETRELISKIVKGRPQEVWNRIAEKRKDYRPTEETKKKISETLKKRTRLDRHRKYMGMWMSFDFNEQQAVMPQTRQGE